MKKCLISLFASIVFACACVPVPAQSPNPNLVTIEATDGQSTIASSNDVFTVFIDPRFDKLNDVQAATPPTDVQIRDIKSDGTIQEIFCSVSENLDKLCLTQSQIRKFCKKNPSKLRSNGLMTFFISKGKNGYFITEVYGFDNALHARYLSFTDPYVWNGEYHHKLVCPVL